MNTTSNEVNIIQHIEIETNDKAIINFFILVDVLNIMIVLR